MSYRDERKPLQVWLPPEMQKAVKDTAHRAGLTVSQAGLEAWSDWLEWQAHIDATAAKAIAAEYTGELATA